VRMVLTNAMPEMRLEFNNTFDDLREVHCSYLCIKCLLSVLLLCEAKLEVRRVVNSEACGR